jgi:hypothetical protein
MQIRMRTLSAGPSGTRHPGEIVDVSEAEAAALVAGGYAEPVAPFPGRSEIQSASVNPPENAALPRPRRRS